MTQAGIEKVWVAFILQDQISLSLEMIYNNLKGDVVF